MRHLVQHTPLALMTLPLLAWARGSVETARRNAMSASTDCAARRMERLEVSDYISTCLAQRAVG